MTSTHSRHATVRSVLLIARREITTRLRSRAFLVSMGALLAFIFVGVVFAGFTARNDALGNAPSVAVTRDLAHGVSEKGARAVVVDNDARALDQLNEGTVDVAVIADSNSPTGFAIIANDYIPTKIAQLLSEAPTIQVLHPVSANAQYAQIAGITFGVIFMWSAVTFGTTIAQSVVEEKQTRIVEILLAMVPSRVLFAGKILGNSFLALTAVVAAVGLAILGATFTGQSLLFTNAGPATAWFAVLFTLGFVLLASLYGALAALVSRQEDVAAATSPVSVVVMVPYLLAVIFSQNQLALQIMSYVPLSAPVAMPLRIFLGVAQPWEPWVAAASVIVSAASVAAFGARVYRNSVLRVDSRVRLLEAIREE